MVYRLNIHLQTFWECLPGAAIMPLSDSRHSAGAQALSACLADNPGTLNTHLQTGAAHIMSFLDISNQADDRSYTDFGTLL